MNQRTCRVAISDGPAQRASALAIRVPVAVARTPLTLLTHCTHIIEEHAWNQSVTDILGGSQAANEVVAVRGTAKLIKPEFTPRATSDEYCRRRSQSRLESPLAQGLAQYSNVVPRFRLECVLLNRPGRARGRASVALGTSLMSIPFDLNTYFKSKNMLPLL
jgi:hypothetical protein